MSTLKDRTAGLTRRGLGVTGPDKSGSRRQGAGRRSLESRSLESRSLESHSLDRHSLEALNSVESVFDFVSRPTKDRRSMRAAQQLAVARKLWRQTSKTVATWRDRARQRRQLRAMGQRGLKDIGQTSGGAMLEASKPFWRG